MVSGVSAAPCSVSLIEDLLAVLSNLALSTVCTGRRS